MRDKYELTEARQREFDQRPGENAYAFVARQIDMATPFELTWLYLLRGDMNDPKKQHEAMAVMQAAKAARAARHAVWAAIGSSVLSAVVAVVAILAS